MVNETIERGGKSELLYTRMKVILNTAYQVKSILLTRLINLTSSFGYFAIFHLVIFCVILFCCMASHKFIDNILEEIIEEKIKELQDSFERQIKDNGQDILIDLIENKMDRLNELEYMYDTENMLDRMFSRYIHYDLSVDGVSLFTNLYSNRDILQTKKRFELNKQIKLLLKVGVNQDSVYFQGLQNTFCKCKSIINIIFFLAELYCLSVVILTIREERNIKKMDDALLSIRKYLKTKKAITTNFHNYYMMNNNQLLSIPIFVEKGEENTRKVNLFLVEEKLLNYAEGYSSIIKNEINLVVIKKTDILSIKFDKEVFLQVIFSVVCNIFHFLKTSELAAVRVVFSKDIISFHYNNSFPINKNTLQNNSDALILNEFSEPFILGFTEIFSTLDSLKVGYKTSSEKGKNLIQIILVEEEKKQDQQKNTAEIIDMAHIFKRKNV